MRSSVQWPNGATARPAKLVPTEDFPSVCSYPVDVYKNYDGSWMAAHFHGGRHNGKKQPVRSDQVEFTDGLDQEGNPL